MAKLRVLIAGGGTGGHIIPALAVARELVARHGAEVLFVGTARGMESRLVPAAGFRLHLIEVGQLKNVSLMTRVRTLLDLAAQHSCLPAAHPRLQAGGGFWRGRVCFRPGDGGGDLDGRAGHGL